MLFRSTYPDYYYRKTKDGKYSDGSGCGNETASEKPLMRQFMLESVKYWIDEYHIDGFRFDLMGVHDIETMQAIREMVNRITRHRTGRGRKRHIGLGDYFIDFPCVIR